MPWRAPARTGPDARHGTVPTSAGWYLEPRIDDATAFVGHAPVAAVAVPMGSYLAIVRMAGYRDVRLPIRIGRNEEVRARVRLHTEAEIGEGLVYVPGGPFISGGDPAAIAPEPRRALHVDGFFIARFPVTCAEYLAFLNDLGRRDPAMARRHAPRWQDHGGMHWLERPEGSWRLPEGKDEFGIAWRLDEPVVEVTWHDATAYCAWLSEKAQRPYRLPTGAEWEKAARGVDGRIFPWGSHLDATWCNTAASRLPGPNRRGPIGEFPADESPYGVRDLAGNVSDWTADLMAADQAWRVARGGNWHGGEIYARAGSRMGYEPTSPNDSFGLRVAISSEPSSS